MGIHLVPLFLSVEGQIVVKPLNYSKRDVFRPLWLDILEMTETVLSQSKKCVPAIRGRDLFGYLGPP